MTILDWEKPEKIMPVEKWKGISADSAPPGVYTPNMSETDRRKWKAKIVHKNTDAPRVEIRKGFKDGVNVVILVGIYGIRLSKSNYRPNAFMRISANGTMELTINEWNQIKIAVDEAVTALENLKE